MVLQKSIVLKQVKMVMDGHSEYDGRSATLNDPYRGYENVVLVKYWPTMYKWEVEISGSGKRIFVYEDEFTLD